MYAAEQGCGRSRDVAQPRRAYVQHYTSLSEEWCFSKVTCRLQAMFFRGEEVRQRMRGRQWFLSRRKSCPSSRGFSSWGLLKSQPQISRASGEGGRDDPQPESKGPRLPSLLWDWPVVTAWLHCDQVTIKGSRRGEGISRAPAPSDLLDDFLLGDGRLRDGGGGLTMVVIAPGRSL